MAPEVIQNSEGYNEKVSIQMLSLSPSVCVCVHACLYIYIYIYNCGEFNHILIRFFVIEGRILYPSHVFVNNLFFLIKKDI